MESGREQSYFLKNLVRAMNVFKVEWKKLSKIMTPHEEIFQLVPGSKY